MRATELGPSRVNVSDEADAGDDFDSAGGYVIVPLSGIGVLGRSRRCSHPRRRYATSDNIALSPLMVRILVCPAAHFTPLFSLLDAYGKTKSFFT